MTLNITSTGIPLRIAGRNLQRGIAGSLWFCVLLSAVIVAWDSSIAVPLILIVIADDAATGPTRELQYLNALRGAAGEPLRFRRVGTTLVESVILDIYELSYEGLCSPLRLYLDGYHFEEPMAPLGFVCPISIGLKP